MGSILNIKLAAKGNAGKRRLFENDGSSGGPMLYSPLRFGFTVGGGSGANTGLSTRLEAPDCISFKEFLNLLGAHLGWTLFLGWGIFAPLVMEFWPNIKSAQTDYKALRFEYSEMEYSQGSPPTGRRQTRQSS